jgi:hypothetical protein
LNRVLAVCDSYRKAMFGQTGPRHQRNSPAGVYPQPWQVAQLEFLELAEQTSGYRSMLLNYYLSKRAIKVWYSGHTGIRTLSFADHIDHWREMVGVWLKELNAPISQNSSVGVIMSVPSNRLLVRVSGEGSEFYALAKFIESRSVRSFFG